MLRTKDDMLARLAELRIEVTTTLHPPVRTVEEAAVHTRHLPGGHCKNLFMKDKKGRLWLLTCLDERRVDLNALSRRLGSARLSFGRPELLREVLGVEPGAVTPLAIANDAQGQVTLLLDQALMAFERINCHPLENDATVTLSSADLLRFIAVTGHEPLLLDLDAA